jgi:hypothetical protein
MSLEKAWVQKPSCFMFDQLNLYTSAAAAQVKTTSSVCG